MRRTVPKRAFQYKDSVSPGGERFCFPPRTDEGLERPCTRTLTGLFRRIHTCAYIQHPGVHACPCARHPEQERLLAVCTVRCSSPVSVSIKCSGDSQSWVGGLRRTVPIEQGGDQRTHPFSWASDWAASPEEELALAWTQQCCLRAPPVLRAALGFGGWQVPHITCHLSAPVPAMGGSHRGQVWKSCRGREMSLAPCSPPPADQQPWKQETHHTVGLELHGST